MKIEKSHINAIILAGGTSRRMGHDKATTLLNGKPFFEHIANAVKPLVNEIIVVSDNPLHNQFGYKRIPDYIKNSGPLVGIYSGLKASNTKWNIVLSCDVPTVNTGVLEYIIENAENENNIVQLSLNGKNMPLVALYKSDCTPVFKPLIDEGEKRLRKGVEKCNVKTLETPVKFIANIQNINTKDDLKNMIL